MAGKITQRLCCQEDHKAGIGMKLAILACLLGMVSFGIWVLWFTTWRVSK